MYHNADDVLQKVTVLNDKADELRRLIAYMGRHKLFITVNMERLETDKKHLVEDIQALAGDLYNDKGPRDE